MRCLVKLFLVLMVLLMHTCYRLLAAETGVWVIDDFEDGNLTATSGLSWIPIADDLAGGETIAALGVRRGGAGGSKHALGLSARLAGGERWPFAGAWLPLDRSGSSVSLGRFTGVRLRVKGPARLQVGFRVGQVNFMAPVEAGSRWSTVEVPFSSLAPLGKTQKGARWTSEGVTTFGVTTPQVAVEGARPEGEVAFEIDDVELYGAAEAGAGPIPAGDGGGMEVLPLAPLSSIPSSGWIDLGDDPARDGNTPSLPDAIRLEANPSAPDGRLWVRVTLREAPHDRWMGMNLVLDVDGDPADGQPWWGSNSSFRFDRLVSVWCMRVEAGCQGFIGLADAEQAAAGRLVAGGGADLRFAIDRERKAFVVGVPREALRIGANEIRLVAAVGSAIIYGDDVPGQGAAILH